MSNWNRRVSEHASYVDNKIEPNGYERMITFLVGSQNYNLATDDSDVDTISICVPKFEKDILSHGRLSKTYLLSNNEHVNVKDIREYIDFGLKKQNINFVETLYTEYVNVNQEYSWLYEELTKIRDEISTYSKKKTLSAARGMIFNNYEGAIINNPWSIEFDGNEEHTDYNGKECCNIMRLLSFIESYMQDKDYLTCIQSPQIQDILLKYKKHEYPIEDVVEKINTIYKYVSTLDFKNDNTDDTKIYLNEILDNIILKVFQKAWKIN